jgi:hypothetical protein
MTVNETGGGVPHPTPMTPTGVAVAIQPARIGNPRGLRGRNRND